MVRQPPKLLTRVIRAIAKLHEEKGSSVPTIVTQVRIALSEGQNVVRNIAMQVRRALKHAVDNGLVIQRAGKFRVAGKRRVVPVDSLEMQVDCRKKRTKKQKKQCPCGRRTSQHDYHKRNRSPKSTKTTRRKRQKREKSNESQKKNPSRTGSEKNVAQQQPQQQQQQQQEEADNHNDNKNMTSRSRSPSSERGRTNSSSDVQGQRHDQLRGSPYPDSSSDGARSSPAPAENRRRGRPPRRRRAPIPPPAYRNNQEGPPTVEDEPIDSPPPRRSVPRNVSPKRPSVPRCRENNPDEERDSDLLDEDHENSRAYYN